MSETEKDGATTATPLTWQEVAQDLERTLRKIHDAVPCPIAVEHRLVLARERRLAQAIHLVLSWTIAKDVREALSSALKDGAR